MRQFALAGHRPCVAGVRTAPLLALALLLCQACAAKRSADPPDASPPPRLLFADLPPTRPTTDPTPAQPTCDHWPNGDFFTLASADLVRECLEEGVDPRDPVSHAPAIFSAAFSATDPAVISLLTGAGADPNVRLGEGGRSRSRPGYTSLHSAAANNPTPGIIVALLEAGADINARDNEGATPLHAAWGNPNPAVFRELLRSGADPLARDERGRVADPTSCLNWNTEVFNRLTSPSEFDQCVRLGEDVSTRDSDGNAPLHWAAATDRPTAATTLLDAGADPNVQNNIGATPLHVASTNQRADIVTLLLDAGAELNAGEGAWGTPLLHAISGRNGMSNRRFPWRPRGISEAAINVLVEAGANLNAADSAGTTPLMQSLKPHRRNGNLSDLPMRLLSLGADPNSRDIQGRTPLLVAASTEGPAVIRALIEAGADPRALSNDGTSALHAAAVSGVPEAIPILADAGVDPNGLNDDGVVPLQLVVTPSESNRWWLPWGNEAAPSPTALRAAALLTAGANPNARNPEGDTPLHLSLWHRDTTLVRELVQAGANVNARNDKGETPLHLARAQGRRPTIRTLLRLGADPDARDNAGRLADPVCYWGPGGEVPAGAPAESVRGCLESGIPVDARDEDGATYLARMVSSRSCCADVANVVQVFVAAGADVNARDDAGRTPLHRAVTNPGRIRGWLLPVVISALLDAGADPNARDSEGSTPLHLAAGGAEASPLVSLLIEAGADLNGRNNASETPLHIAFRSDAPATARTLLQYGADPAVPDGAGAVPDPAACDRWGTSTFFTFATADIVAGCIAAGADVRSMHGRGRLAVPLISVAAGSSRDPGAISVLLEAGADPHARDAFYQYTPLHHAARSGHPGVAVALLEAGADPNAWATGFNIDWGWGWTPLHLAARSNPDPDVVKALLEAGADLDARSAESYREGLTPLHYAGWNPKPGVAAALLDAGADVNALSRGGRTPLHDAAGNASNPAVIELLIAAGAEVNARDNNGDTPLHSAAWYNPHPHIVTALIAGGADVDARDPQGYAPSGRRANSRTPLFMAIRRDGVFSGGQPMPSRFNVPVVAALVRGGADLKQTDTYGQTPLHAVALVRPAAYPLLIRMGADPNVRDAYGKTPLDYAVESGSLEGLPEVRRLREAMRRSREP